MAAYSLSRFNYKYKNILFLLVVFTIVVPPQTAQIPMFVSFRNFNFFGVGKLVGLITGKDMTVNLINTQWSLILPSVFAAGLQAGLFIFIFRQFFLGMPKGLEEAAKVDGAGLLRICWGIVMPNCKPALMTIIIFEFQTSWNQAGGGLVYDEALKTIPVVVQQIAAAGIARQGAIAASAVVLMIPPLLVFVLAQRNVMETMAHAGMKD